ncbi:hypothetical protein Y032_0792g2375 [Ancylostoma ceylanicum]|uniref:Uncharacterized protein n=1 Tax=Ancylostoma ceylanicum TaxID=53326 RepID=A0A016WCU0_9BILA|nr:hypothetical protein Y032_0792g2375 [Ancylostoma ceylanicum]
MNFVSSSDFPLQYKKAGEKKEIGLEKEKMWGNKDKEVEMRNTQMTEEQPLLAETEAARYKPLEHRSKLEERSKKQDEAAKERKRLSLSESAENKAISQLNTTQMVMDVQVAKEKKA